MRASIILSLAASTWAYAVTSPSQTTTWTLTGTQSLTWTKVSTDNATFNAVLSNEDRTFLATNNVVLATAVDGTKGSLSITLPTSGITPGDGFRVNLLQVGSSAIYAQSNEFNITKGTASTTSAPSTGGATTGATKVIPTDVDGNAIGSTGTDTDTPGPEETSNNAAGPAAVAQIGFMAIFIAAISLFA